MIERYVDLDERWFFDLAKDPEGRKTYGDMADLQPGRCSVWKLRRNVHQSAAPQGGKPGTEAHSTDYFRIRSEKVRVEESITVYKDAAERFGDE